MVAIKRELYLKVCNGKSGIKGTRFPVCGTLL